MSERHQPKRGSDVEAWLKEARDSWAITETLPSGRSFVRRPDQYWAIDELLDDYRERADEGEPLLDYEPLS